MIAPAQRARGNEVGVQGASRVRASGPQTSGLAPFTSYYPGAKCVPQLKKGATSQTYNAAQVQALHRAYWSAPVVCDLDAMVRLAFKDAAFKGLKPDANALRQVSRVFTDFPESFPFGWRSRALAATSHALVNALVTHPEGSPVQQIFEELKKAMPGFPVERGGWHHTVHGPWADEPDRFPFVDRLPKEGKFRRIVATGSATEIHTDAHGRFPPTEVLARKVGELILDPRIHYNWASTDVAKFIDGELNGGGAFTERSLRSLNAQFPHLVPGQSAIHEGAARRLAEDIRRIHDHEGVTTAQEMNVLVLQRFGVEFGPTGLAGLRVSFPDLVPNFRAGKDAAAYADARALLEAIKQDPEHPYEEVAAKNGYTSQRAHELLRLIHKRWPDELPKQAVHRYTAQDRAEAEGLLRRTAPR